jgi:hypothetical protein
MHRTAKTAAAMAMTVTMAMTTRMMTATGVISPPPQKN